jgi:copper homeostasis protein
MQLEICTENLDSVLNAHFGGADRIELCSALIEGGITPSFGFIQIVAEKLIQLGSKMRIHVLIRPRSADFCYSEGEKEIIKQDVRNLLRIAQEYKGKLNFGIVSGALLENGELDKEWIKEIVELCRDNLSFTFHRAFDMTREENMLENLKFLDDLRVDYLLTSGLSFSAVSQAGKLNLFNMIKYKRDHHLKIEIIGAGGITIENILELREQTGLREFHASARSVHDGKMKYRKSGVYMGGEKKNDSLDVEYTFKVSLQNTVKDMKSSLSM